MGLSLFRMELNVRLRLALTFFVFITSTQLKADDSGNLSQFLRSDLDAACVNIREQYLHHSHRDLFVQGARMKSPCGPVCMVHGVQGVLQQKGLLIPQKEILQRLVDFNALKTETADFGKVDITAEDFGTAVQAVLREYDVDSK